MLSISVAATALYPMKIRILRLLAGGAILVAPWAVRAAPGDLDPLKAQFGPTDTSYVRATAVQTDGRIIIVGNFTSVLGVPRNYIARLNTDGTLDTSFDPNPNRLVYCVAVQADGKLLLGGEFTALRPNGAALPTDRFRIARVNVDGTLDMGFDPKANGAINCLGIQADGNVVLGGSFSTLQPNGAASPFSRQNIARINADGMLDMGFDPKANGVVRCVTVQPDGKVLLGGDFFRLQPNGAPSFTQREFIARVNADGTVDAFNPKASDIVQCIVVQPDGKVLFGGGFTTLQPNGALSPTNRYRIARVNADGTLDTGFDPRANGGVSNVAVQADGKVLLCGNFNALQPNGATSSTPRRFFARVNADGTLDTHFDPNPSFVVNGVEVQADGKVLLGGFFDSFEPSGAAKVITRDRFTRLYNDLATQTLSVPNASQVLWSRSGATTEVSRVTFELSTDGGASWSLLGAGSRVGTTANWQLTDLSLPATGQIRARGATIAGLFNGSSGLVEDLVAFPSVIEPWKLAHLGDADAPDLDDPDHDGLFTLAEYGLLLPPEIPSQLPHASAFPYAEGRRLRMLVPRDPAHNDITVRIEATSDLAGLWTTLATSTLGAPFTGAGYVGGDDATPGLKTVEVRDILNLTDGGQRFLRVRVTH